MFDERELQIIGAALEREVYELSFLERRGIPTALQVAQVAAVRAKALEEAGRIQKIAAQETNIDKREE
jgi:hypothetical protein